MSRWNELINAEKPVLVDFSAEWCGPCKTLAPILKELKSRMGDRIKIVKVDVDANPGIASELQISGVPTLILYHRGKSLWRQSGVLPVNSLQEIIEKQIA